MDTPRSFVPIPARPRPLRRQGPWRWALAHLFASPASAAVTLALLALAVWTLPALFDWAVLQAVWRADPDACQVARGHGACWGVIAEKHRLIVFGRYPYESQWRPALATALLLALVGASGLRRCWHRGLLVAWALGLALVFALLRGGVAGLAPVSTDRWGGLPLTVLLATVSIAAAVPIAVAVALGRRSRMPGIRSLCALYVELIRSVPLISVLFMASFLFPLFMPAGTTPDVLLRVLVGITLFAAAYLAEIVRAGLQAVPLGQGEAAASIGLSWWQAQRRVVLPQALGTVVPGLLNSFIGVFKDTSLVTIVSLYELTGSLGLALNGDPVWRPFQVEGWLFITAVYFVFCHAMSRYSRWVEARLARARAR